MESGSGRSVRFISTFGHRFIEIQNHIGYHDLFDQHAPKGSAGRKAMALAGDAEEDIQTTSELIDALGFDPVPIGVLANGILLEPGTKAFGASVDAEALREMIEASVHTGVK